MGYDFSLFLIKIFMLTKVKKLLESELSIQYSTF